MKPWLRTLIRWLLRLALLAVVVAVVVTLPLRWIDPPGSAFMLADRVLNDREVTSEWVPYERISPHLALAVVAAEDQNFPIHYGFDLIQIRDAVETHRRGGRLRGASTISQQLARNLYLWPQRSWIRKGLESVLTVPLELFLPKTRMLELYLNIAEFDTGVYGAQAAARHYFDKDAAQLGRGEAALLAAVLPAPKYFDAAAPDDRMLERQRWILDQMDNLGSDWLP